LGRFFSTRGGQRSTSLQQGNDRSSSSPHSFSPSVRRLEREREREREKGGGLWGLGTNP
jgi:hypothetical protein